MCKKTPMGAFLALVLAFWYFLFGEASAQSVLPNRTAATRVPMVLGFQRSSDGINTEPCPFGFFNDDVTRERCQSCGVGVSTSTVAATGSNECSVCDIEYIGVLCLVCRTGFYQKVDNGVCEVMRNVVITLHVTIFVRGTLGNNLENQIVDAFSDILKVTPALFTNITTQPALTMPGTVATHKISKVSFNILVDGSIQANQLQRSVENINTTLLYTYPGLLGTNATVHTTYLSVDTSAVKQQSNLVFIIVVCVASGGSLILLVVVLSCLCKKATHLSKKTRSVTLNALEYVHSKISKKSHPRSARSQHPRHEHATSVSENQPLTTATSETQNGRDRL